MNKFTVIKVRTADLKTKYTVAKNGIRAIQHSWKTKKTAQKVADDLTQAGY
tara:strand:+ start:90 stop:242 length:153 start_codon:yes stop_codon:yes gene_type:complete